jgi:hypothetical protein
MVVTLEDGIVWMGAKAEVVCNQPSTRLVHYIFIDNPPIRIAGKMSNKKRKLSPSLSSRSSTPALGIPATASSPPPDNLPPISSGASGSIATSRAGSVFDTTPAATSRHDAIASRTEMRMPTITPGSGDGAGYGDECFVWQDLPTQTGMSPLAIAEMELSI